MRVDERSRPIEFERADRIYGYDLNETDRWFEELDQPPSRFLPLRGAAADRALPSWAGVHTCHSGCICHEGGSPAPDFEES